MVGSTHPTQTTQPLPWTPVILPLQRGEMILDLLMVAKYLERIGDHATNVAEWVVYSITAVHPDEKVGK